MAKKRGVFYYQSNQESCHGDQTVILCTESTIHGKSFSGVCVRAGNSTFVGQFSEHWTEHIFDKEVSVLVNA